MDKYFIAIIASLISGFAAIYVSRKRIEKEIKLAEDKIRHEYKIEHSVEEAIRQLMKRGFALRSLPLIKHHIRGFDDNELRQLLLRSGCICFRVINEVEFWGLLEENESELPSRSDLEKQGMKFYD